MFIDDFCGGLFVEEVWFVFGLVLGVVVEFFIFD